MKVAICGSFGFSNIGDEAIPEAIVDLGLNLGISIEPAVIGRYDEPAMPSVIGLSDRDKARRASLRGLPLLVSGGGIIDNTTHSVIFRCKDLLDRNFSSKTALFGISVEAGVPYNWRCRFRLKKLLREIDIIYTRDDLSEQTLSQLLPGRCTETIGDLVLWLKSEPSEIACLGLPERYIAVNLAQRWSSDPNWQYWVSKELVNLARGLNVDVVFVPMTGEYDDDRIEHRLIAEKVRLMAPEIRLTTIESLLTPRAVAAILGGAELVVSMRLHGCVIAFAQQTACVGLGYHPKLFGFFETVKLKDLIIPERPPVKQSKGIYGYAFSDLQLREGELVDAARRSLAKRDFTMLPVLKQRSAAAFLKIMGLGNPSKFDSIQPLI